jgi:transglutaminase-like putative cysteine protease
MAYCRRNSFDSYAKAFERGYGYCQQSAYALAAILRDLGFHAEPVHCERCEFPDGPGGHAWVRVEYHGEVRDLDPMYQAEDGVGLVFRPLGSVRRYTPFFRALSGWGCTAVNAIRYYRTGSDSAEPGNADTQADAPVKPTRQGPPDYPS